MSAYVAVADSQIAWLKASAEHPTDRIRNAGGERNGSQAGREMRGIASRQIMGSREELDPGPLHTGRVDLVEEGCTKILDRGRYDWLKGTYFRSR
jgi:hypothetical protein